MPKGLHHGSSKCKRSSRVSGANDLAARHQRHSKADRKCESFVRWCFDGRFVTSQVGNSRYRHRQESLACNHKQSVCNLICLSLDRSAYQLKLMSIYLPNREELLLRLVLAFPKASRIGFVCSSLSLTDSTFSTWPEAAAMNWRTFLDASVFPEPDSPSIKRRYHSTKAIK
jgi:hypothetical protein